MNVIAVGRLKSGPERQLVERYVERVQPLARSLGFGGVDIAELAESPARHGETRKAEEAQVLLGRCAAGPLVAFDERGAALTSETFAVKLGQWRDEGRGDISFVIGGPDGLDAQVRSRAALVVSFGGMTMPHQLVRVLVLEQLYRSMTILSGHPYHRV